MAKIDQAEGLRRMLAVPRPRVISFLTVLPHAQKNTLLVNLAAALAQQGQSTLLLDARNDQGGVSSWFNLHPGLSLLEVANQQRNASQVIKPVANGLSAARLGLMQGAARNRDISRRLADVFEFTAKRFDIILVDANCNSNGELPLASLDDSEIVVQLSAETDQIMSAYGLIKRIQQRNGRRSFGIMVTETARHEAKKVFQNMAEVADRYLASPLDWIGNIPSDDKLHTATASGRTIIEAFPSAPAAQAYFAMAEHFHYQSDLGLSGRQESGVGLGI